MLTGRRYINDNVFFIIFKKHFCSACGVRLNRVKVSKVVNSKSPESKNYDFSLGDGFMHGDVKFIWNEFQCPNCDVNYTLNEIKNAKKGKKDRRENKRLEKSTGLETP